MLRPFFPGILLWIIFCGQAPLPPGFVLRPGEVFERELAPATSHTYQIELDSSGSWYVAVRQKDVDVVLTIRGPGGESLVAVDSPLDRQGQETALFEAKVTGLYHVEVRAREAVAVTGRYEIRIDRLRDPRRLEAAAAATEGARLYLEGTPEAWRQALAANSRAFELWHGLGETPAAARALYSNAVLHRLLDESRRALALSQQVLPLWRKEGNQIFTANTWNEIGLNHWLLGKTREARSFFTRALAAHGEIGHRWGVAVVSANLCLMDLVEGDLRGGATCHERVIPLLDEVRALDLAGTAASNAGRAYNLLGEPEKALASYKKALEFARALGDRGTEARTLNNLGVLHREIGEFREALATFGQALAIFQQTGRRRWQAHVLNNFGAAYQTLGQLDQALIHYHQALDLWREIENPRSEATTLVNLALAHRRLKQPREAQKFLTQALTSWRAIGDRREEALTLAHLGRVAMDLGEFVTAAHLLGQGALALGELGDRVHEAEALIDLGAALNALAQPQKAREHLRRALELARAQRSPSSEVRSLAGLARSERLEGFPARARGHVETAIELFESERLRVWTPALRASFASTFYDLYDLYIDLLLAAGDTRGALEVSERVRARTLLELVQESGADLDQKGDPKLLARRRSLHRRLSAKAARTARVALTDAEPALKSALAEEQTAILRELDLVEALLHRTTPERGARPSTAAEIQALLDDDTLLLVFALGETRSVLWRVDAGTITAHHLPPRQDIEKAARRVHVNLRRFEPAARHQDAEAAAELVDLLLGPVASQLEARRLVIVPDGALFYVPFEALPLPRQAASTPQDLPKRYLLDRYEIVYLSSASVLATQRRAAVEPRPAGHTLAVLADPVFDPSDPRLSGREKAPGRARGRARGGGPRFERLPATRQEAEALAALAAPGEVLKALGFEATRSRVLGESLSPYRFIHFATHGVIDTETPALSALVLSLYDREGRPREGFLSLRDIYGLRLNAELVVLSGCRTALGRQMRGEGLWGLTRGFLAAGARRVLATLWRVEDRAAAELMRRFYSALWREGLTPAAALRSAKLSLRRERRWRDPHFWASFVLEGDWRS
jgi:CHAT domain-containing protein/Tfp pilus assembly protein PilF